MPNVIKGFYDFLVSIRFSFPPAFRKELLQGNEAIEWMKNEFKKLKEFLNYYPYKPKLAGVTMYDGGNVMKGAVSHLDEIGLRDFEEMFLML